MNSTKKTVKGQTKSQTKKPIAESNGMGKKIVIGVLLGIILLVIGVVAWEGLAPKYLIAINGTKMKQQDLIYDIYDAEMLGASMADLYAQLGLTVDYWTMDQGDGNDTQDVLKSQVIQDAEEIYILYQEAMNAGYTITEEEKAEKEKVVNESLETLGTSKAKKLGMTKEKWIKRLEDAAVAYRYRDDIIADFNIDEEAIKEGIDYESFRGYEVDYFFIPTTTENEEGESVEVADKQEVLKELEEVLAKAKVSNDWSEVIDSEDETAVVSYQSDTFTRQDEGFKEETMNAVFAMENGAISEIMEEDDGYYVFLMKNNNSSEEYDSQVEEAISAEENERFEDYFEELKEEKYTVKIYDNNWDSIFFGSITL